jgi:hypothetical protein
VDGTSGAPVVVPLNFDRSVGGFFVDDEDAAKDETESIGDDGSAARRDAALGNENDEVGESRVDLLGGFERGDGFSEKIGGEVSAIGGGRSRSGGESGVFRAKAGGRV